MSGGGCHVYEWMPLRGVVNNHVLLGCSVLCGSVGCSVYRICVYVYVVCLCVCCVYVYVYGACVYASMSAGESEQRKEMPRPAIGILPYSFLFSPGPFSFALSPPTPRLHREDIQPPTGVEGG